MDFLPTGISDVPGSPAEELGWVWLTIALSALVALGYAVIGFNWYFQKKLSRRKESAEALRHLQVIFLICVTCGYLFYTTRMSWIVWRFYDVILFALAFKTWALIFRMRGLSLVDERLAQLEELEKTCEKYREIAELLPHMVWTATADGQIDFCNRKWVEYAGEGRTWLDTVHPDERQDVAQWWKASISRRETVSREARLGDGDGYRTFLVSATPIMRGEVVKWLGACADVEDQKLLALERERQARQKLFFLNALSHDLRAPLNTISLNAQMLQISMKEPALAVQTGAIVEDAASASEMITKLLDFVKVGAQDYNRLESLSLSASLSQIIRRFLPVAEKKGLYLRLSGRLNGRIVTDRVKFERIIGNLVDNALKYTNEGGVEIAIGEEEEGVCVSVSDTGVGIPEKHARHLFDEFYQVNNPERDREKGFGLGLAICRCLAAQLGGDVSLAHTGPGGSCFKMRIAGALSAAESADELEPALCPA